MFCTVRVLWGKWSMEYGVNEKERAEVWRYKLGFGE